MTHTPPQRPYPFPTLISPSRSRWRGRIHDSLRPFYPFVLVAIVALFPAVANADAWVQVDVALVRARPSATAEVVTRLPINTRVEVTVSTPGPEGYLSIKRFLQPRPAVIGVCLGSRVVILTELRDGKPIPLVDEFPDTVVDAPGVLKSAARLRARALELTTTRFYETNGFGWSAEGFLVIPSVVTTDDVTSTIRNHIDLGPCPELDGEVETSLATIFGIQVFQGERLAGEAWVTLHEVGC